MMSDNTAKNNNKTINSPTLTSREQEIMKLLLTGSSPKEIAGSLNISRDTVLAHKKNLYRKLDVQSIQELFAKFHSSGAFTELAPSLEIKSVEMSASKKPFLLRAKLISPKFLIPAGISAAGLIIIIMFVLIAREKGTAAVFTRLDIFNDDFGSHITLTPNIENIQDKYIETYSISGNLSQKASSYTGVIAIPDPSTHEAMKKMKRFSLTVLGDGKTYTVSLPTTEARQEGGSNFYCVFFTTKNGVISAFTFYIEELTQSPYFGKKVPFVQDNIEALQIQPFTKGDFNLKFWDIKIHL
jgi:DNA-binding CsgD family transcriptional regulator